MNARRSPGWILDHHLEDEIPRFLRQSSPPDSPSRLGDQFPVQTEASPVPAHDCFGGHNDERLFPTGPEAPNAPPKQLVSSSKLWPRMSSFQRNELLPENEILKDEIAAASEQARECTEPE